MAAGPSTDTVLKTYADRPFEEVKLDGMRKTIAARLTEAKQSVPHFYLRRDIQLDALMKFRSQLISLDGTLSVTEPSDAVSEILKLMNLDALLIGSAAAKKAAAPKVQEEKRVLELPNAVFDVYSAQADASLVCRAVGDPSALPRCAFDETHCRSLSLPQNAFAVGLGALGSDYADCRTRFGEFIAVGGAAAYLPTDRGNVPDYLISAEGVVPELQLLYGLACEGEFSHILNFEAKPDATVSLLDIASQCIKTAERDAVGVVMAAEVVGLVGAALRQSPAMAATGAAPFDHPEIRDWMTFTSEAAYTQSVALAAGVISQKENKALDPMVRPLGAEDSPKGHCHAAAFSYRPLRKGQVDLAEIVRALFEEEILQGVLHLINDTRSIDGTGQSEFVRGTCWLAPISTVEQE